MALFRSVDHLQRLVKAPRLFVASLLAAPVRRRVWRVLTVVSLLLVGAGVYVAWSRWPADQLELAPRYIALAGIIYLLSYVVQLLGWHGIAGHFFGRIPFAENARAIASSSLVKFLPTIIWYIANRADFYKQYGIAHSSVIAASLLELVMMIGWAAFLYLAFWISHTSTLFAVVVSALLGLLLVGLLLPGGRLRVWWRERVAIHRSDAQSLSAQGGPWWIGPLFWYALSWPLGVCFIWAILHAFVPLLLADLWPLASLWLLACLSGYISTLTFGGVGITREITLTFLLSQIWPLPVAVATSLLIKVMLLAGELGCAACILGVLHVARKRHSAA